MSWNPPFLPEPRLILLLSSHSRPCSGLGFGYSLQPELTREPQSESVRASQARPDHTRPGQAKVKVVPKSGHGPNVLRGVGGSWEQGLGKVVFKSLLVFLQQQSVPDS